MLKKFGCLGFVCAASMALATPPSEAELVRELTGATYVLDGATIETIAAAQRVLQANPKLSKEGKLVSSYLIAVSLDESVAAIRFVPRTENGVSLRKHGAIETKVTVDRRTLRVLNTEYFF